jgi:phosphoglycerol geranylgeranyltransferase
MDSVRKNGAGYFVLLDPEGRYSLKIEDVVTSITRDGADAILLGGSSVRRRTFDDFVRKVKSNTNLPLIVFPGSADQLSEDADAVLFLSLVSGRNPRYLIEEHVKAAPTIRKMGLETIPVGYIIVGSGSRTSVATESGTDPINSDDVDCVVAHALAAKYLGMKMVYMDAGSGAELSVPEKMIEMVKAETGLPLIVGGGIRSPEDAAKKVEAGADFVVTGNMIEQDPSLVAEFRQAIHRKPEN